MAQAAKGQYDLIVIGGGSGGVRAARRAAAHGARVLLAESAALGGTCVNIGCVPKKLLYYAAGVATSCQLAKRYGYADAAPGAFAWQQLIENKNAEIKRLNAIYAQLLQTAKVDIAHGTAALQDAHTVTINGAACRAEHILLAAGGEPSRPNIPGAEHAALSDDLFFLPQLPRRVVLVGAGYIALEFAGIFNGLGAHTTLCYRADQPMRALDDDMRQRLADGMRANGIHLQPNATPQKISKHANSLQLHLADGQTLEADLIVFATGRKPRTALLNLPAANITPDARGAISVDDDYRTSCPSVYAIGDLINTPALTPVAIHEAEIFTRRLFGGSKHAAMDYDAVPTAIFSRPGIAAAGLSEKTAQARGLAVTVDTASHRPMHSAFGGSAAESYIKLISEKVTEDSGNLSGNINNGRANARVIGAQMLGDHAAEIMQGLAVAIKAGATRADFAATVGIHPTSAEEFVTLFPAAPPPAAAAATAAPSSS